MSKENIIICTPSSFSLSLSLSLSLSQLRSFYNVHSKITQVTPEIIIQNSQILGTALSFYDTFLRIFSTEGKPTIHNKMCSAVGIPLEKSDNLFSTKRELIRTESKSTVENGHDHRNFTMKKILISTTNRNTSLLTEENWNESLEMKKFETESHLAVMVENLVITFENDDLVWPTYCRNVSIKGKFPRDDIVIRDDHLKRLAEICTEFNRDKKYTNNSTHLSDETNSREFVQFVFSEMLNV